MPNWDESVTGRASFLHWCKDGSPLALQQHHDESGRFRVADVAPDDVNIGGPLVERLPCLERDGRLAFQLHNDLAFEHIDERMGVVPMDHILGARGIRHLNYATLLARVIREIDREQFLHVCGFARNGWEHQECRQVSAEVKVRFPHTLSFQRRSRDTLSRNRWLSKFCRSVYAKCADLAAGSRQRVRSVVSPDGGIRVLSVSGGAIRRDRCRRGALRPTAPASAP